jgi:hemolysin activation/secretion protein
MHQNQIKIPAPQGFGTPRGAENFHFVLKRVEISGAHALSSDAIATTYKSLIGQDVTLARIFEVARAITDLYSKSGYALSFGLVPAQQVDPATGVVKVDVVEGYVSEVRYDGDTRGLSKIADGYNGIVTSSHPLKTAALERFLLLLNDIPGYSVSGVFDRIPDSPLGATRLIVKVAYKPYNLVAGVDNRGSKAFGPYQASATVQLNSLLGQGESILLHGLKALNSNQLSAAVGRITLPLGADGLNLAVEATYSDAHPGSAQLSAVHFASSGWTGDVRLNYPLWRGRAESLWVWGGVAGKALRSELLASPFSRDRLYELQGGAIYDARDDQGQTNAYATITQGLGIFNATTASNPLRSRLAGSGEFTAITASASRLQSLAQTAYGEFDFYDALLGQVASRGLLSVEQCGYGGAFFGRGFDNNEMFGDHCLMDTAELRWTPASVTSLTALDTLQFFAVVDAGAVWNTGTLGLGDKRSETGMTVGAGIRFQAFQHVSGTLEFDQPLGHGVALDNNNHAGRVFFQLGLAN